MLRNEEIHKLYYSPNMMRMMKCRLMLWVERSTHGTGVRTGFFRNT
jgi:hypothetical protein